MTSLGGEIPWWRSHQLLFPRTLFFTKFGTGTCKVKILVTDTNYWFQQTVCWFAFYHNQEYDDSTHS